VQALLAAAARSDEKLSCAADQTSASRDVMSNESASCQRSASSAVSAPVSNSSVQQIGRLTVLDGGIRMPADMMRIAQSPPAAR
jgi:hypothetical protein